MALQTATLFKQGNVGGNLQKLSDEDLTRLHAELLSMLIEFSKFCNENGIEWCLCGGACLGAVRSRGFIPWDDDLDLFIERSQFEKLRQAFPKWDKGYILHTPQNTKGFGLITPRIRSKGLVYKDREDLGLNEDYGPFIEFFVLENAPRNPFLRYLHGFISLALGFILSCRKFYEYRLWYRDSVQGHEATRAVNAKAFIGRLFSFRSIDSWCQAWWRWNGLVKRRTGLICSPAGRGHYFGEMYRRRDFFPVSQGVFEGYSMPLPAHPEVFLSTLYGPDYMTPPPENARESHMVLKFDLGEKTNSEELEQ